MMCRKFIELSHFFARDIMICFSDTIADIVLPEINVVRNIVIAVIESIGTIFPVGHVFK